MDESPVRVEYESRVLGSLNQTLHGSIVKTQIQNRVHHPRHGFARARANRDEQRVVGGAETPIEDFFHPREGLCDLPLDTFRITMAVRIVVAAYGGTDRKSRRDGDPNPSHFMQACAFAAEQIAHNSIAFSFPVSKKENIPFLVRHDFASSSRLFNFAVDLLC